MKRKVLSVALIATLAFATFFISCKKSNNSSSSSSTGGGTGGGSVTCYCTMEDVETGEIENISFNLSDIPAEYNITSCSQYENLANQNDPDYYYECE